jgi:hypothetical protein
MIVIGRIMAFIVGFFILLSGISDASALSGVDGISDALSVSGTAIVKMVFGVFWMVLAINPRAVERFIDRIVHKE